VCTFFRVGTTRFVNIDQIISIYIPPNGDKTMLLMADHTVIHLTSDETSELMEVIYVTQERDGGDIVE
jgi:hypothetical protein